MNDHERRRIDDDAEWNRITLAAQREAYARELAAQDNLTGPQAERLIEWRDELPVPVHDEEADGDA